MSAFTVQKLMRSTCHWTSTVITRAVVFVRIANTILKESIVITANPSSIDLGISHSTQPTYVNVSLFKIQVRYFLIVMNLNWIFYVFN